MGGGVVSPRTVRVGNTERPELDIAGDTWAVVISDHGGYRGRLYIDNTRGGFHAHVGVVPAEYRIWGPHGSIGVRPAESVTVDVGLSALVQGF